MLLFTLINCDFAIPFLQLLETLSLCNQATTKTDALSRGRGRFDRSVLRDCHGALTSVLSAIGRFDTRPLLGFLWASALIGPRDEVLRGKIAAAGSLLVGELFFLYFFGLSVHLFCICYCFFLSSCLDVRPSVCTCLSVCLSACLSATSLPL